MDNKALMTINASAPRRAFALGVLGLLGILLVYLGFAAPGDVVGRVFLVAAGGLSLWVLHKMYHATLLEIYLTDDALCDSSGQEIAKLDDILMVERGTFAFKPSAGFIITLKSKQENAWRPGLWWRLGKRIGVGGVTNAGQNKAMSEILTAEVAKRQM